MDASSTCHPDDGTAGPSSFTQILDDGPEDVVWPIVFESDRNNTQ